MNLLLVADGHYLKSIDNLIYSESVYSYDFYKRYLTTFDHIYAVVRTKNVDTITGNEKLCSGENVTFLELPEYRGPIEYAKKYLKLRKCISQFIKKGDCAIFRLPGATANLVAKMYIKTKKPFAIEVVVDPWENFAPKSIKNPLRPIIRIAWTMFLKKMCLAADGVSYVTEQYLQNRYPNSAMKNKKGYFQSYYSSVELPDDMFGEQKKYEEKKKFVISHVSNSYTGYGKGHIPLMSAVKLVNEDGFDTSIEFVGDGPLRKEFEQFAKENGIADKVHFNGRVADSSVVRNIIKNSDLFVFPTRAEGLPRVLLEAMAEGLPCISSPTCGIPEVLSYEYLCEYDDYILLSKKIEKFFGNPKLMEEESLVNLNTSRKYSRSILTERRNSFYEQLMAKCGCK